MLDEESEIDAEGASTDTDGRATPLKAVRRHCLDCCGGSSNEVALCVSKSCPLWLLRFGRRPTADEIAAVGEVATHPAEVPMVQGELVQDYTPLRAIRRRCLDCSGGSVAEVARCRFGPDAAKNPCDLHPHRMRTGSKRKPITEADRERLRALRQSDGA